MTESKHQDAAGALTIHAPSQFSAASALGDLRAAAVEVGKSKGLQNSRGEWFCWGCGTEMLEFHVSLHCPGCLAAARSRREAAAARERAKSPAERQWEDLADLLRTNRALDRNGALDLLKRARELPTHTAARMQGLNLVFDKRFDEARAGTNWNTYAGHASNDDGIDEAFR